MVFATEPCPSWAKTHRAFLQNLGKVSCGSLSRVARSWPRYVWRSLHVSEADGRRLLAPILRMVSCCRCLWWLQRSCVVYRHSSADCTLGAAMTVTPHSQTSGRGHVCFLLLCQTFCLFFCCATPFVFVFIVGTLVGHMDPDVSSRHNGQDNNSIRLTWNLDVRWLRRSAAEDLGESCPFCLRDVKGSDVHWVSVPSTDPVPFSLTPSAQSSWNSPRWK